MPYVDIRGISSHVEVTGSGEPVLFLHGGFCSAAVMRPLADELSAYQVHAPERPGHGRTPDRPGPMSYADGLADTVAYLDAAGIESAHVVGFSDGAIIGLLLARDHPDRVRSLVAVAGNLHPGEPGDVWVPEDRQADAMPEEAGAVLQEEYDALSPEPPGHSEDFLARMVTMWEEQPDIAPESLAAVRAPVLVMAGDRDMVALDHTVLVAESVPGARLCVLPGSHMLVREQPALVGAVVAEFLRPLAQDE